MIEITHRIVGKPEITLFYLRLRNNKRKRGNYNESDGFPEMISFITNVRSLTSVMAIQPWENTVSKYFLYSDKADLLNNRIQKVAGDRDEAICCERRTLNFIVSSFITKPRGQMEFYKNRIKLK